MEWNSTQEDIEKYMNHNGSISENVSTHFRDVGEYEDSDVLIWDIPSIRFTFILLHSIVFFFCFLGNLTVILVVTLHWRMRSITNFCLANLAFADLCVSIFCVFQNLYSHMSENWVLGKVVCKIYHFINEMSLTASVLILVVISIERYLAIIHPMRCKSWLTPNRLRLTIGSVWGISAIYSLPRLYYTTVISHGYVMDDGDEELICTPNRQLYNSKLFDGIHMGLLFFFPLLIITILYTVIGIALWRSSRGQIPVSAPSETSSSSGTHDVQGRLLKPRSSRPSCRHVLCCSSDSFKSNGSQRQKKRELENTNRHQEKILSQNLGKSLECQSLRPPMTSPYSSQREFGSGTPNTTEPIVVVKFEKRTNATFHCRSTSKNHSKCTILMNVPPSELMSITTTSASNGELSSGGSATTGEKRIDDKSSTRQELYVSAIKLGEKKELSGSSILRQTNTIGAEQNIEGGGSGKNDNDSIYPTSSSEYEQGHHLHQSLEGSPGSVPYQRTHKLRRLRVIRGTNYGTKALEARRKIIKMLIVIVLTFALCNLPFHGRKIWQNWSSSYNGSSSFSGILTQVTTMIRYANSAINPLLYAFMSLKFRQSLADLLKCRLRRSFRSTRNFSIRSTNIIPISTAT